MNTNAPCELLPWDTNFFKMRIARFTSSTLSPSILADTEIWCRDNDIDCVYFLAPLHPAPSVRLAEDFGFRLMDVRVTLRRELSIGGAFPSPSSRMVIRGVHSHDVAKLESMSEDLYRHSRFYTDPNFSDEHCAALYSAWIRKSCDGYADEVFVAEKQGEPAGYITLKVSPDKTETAIGLMGIGVQSRQQGTGTLLLDHAIAWSTNHGATATSVVTQIRNVGAMRLYEKAGFRTSAVDLWYHWWPKKQPAENI